MNNRRKKSDRRKKSTIVLRISPDGIERAEIPHRSDRRKPRRK